MYNVQAMAPHSKALRARPPGALILYCLLPAADWPMPTPEAFNGTVAVAAAQPVAPCRE